IAKGIYCIIIVSPEKILGDKQFDTLWKNKTFMANLFNVSIDEGYCVSQWGAEFCPEYTELGRLQFILPKHVCFHIVSATMPKWVLSNVKNKLQMQNRVNVIIQCSNNCPNIYMVVGKMKYPVNTYLDVRHALNLGAGKPKKFMVFINRCHKAELMVEELWKDLKQMEEGSWRKVKWFHSGMSAEFREDHIQFLKDSEVWGLGLDLLDVEVVIQWRYTPLLCTLLQWFGCGVCGRGKIAIVLYLVEPIYFDDNKHKRKHADDGSQTRNEGSEGDNSKISKDDSSPVQTQSQGQRDIGDNQLSENQKETIYCPQVPSIQKDPKHIPFPKSHGKSDTKYKEEVMDLFINAESRDVCRRAISN
ncbi:ATP-dependent DNA helicase RecQ, partial [Leucoagaricus sp. SymC.cos]